MDWIKLLEIQGLFLLFGLIYRVSLSKYGCFTFNRWYLLLSPLLAIGLPFVEIGAVPELATINLAQITVDQEISNVESTMSKTALPGFGFYLAVAILLLAIISYQLIKIHLNSEPVYGYPIKTRVNKNIEGPFTIFSTLYAPNNEIKSEIIEHESVHIKEGHFADLVLLHLIALTFWFNPATWMLIKYAKLNHEFLADRSVIDGKSNSKTYKESLLQQALNTRVPMVSHGFINLNELKTRIKMMNTANHKKQAWKTLFWSIPMILLVVIACNQKPTIEEEIPVLTIAEEMPKFKGGDQELFKFLSENISYPKDAVKDSVQGVVLVSFVINEKGEVTDPKVLKGIHPRLDEEALNIVEKMPDWAPGKDKGAPVKVKYNLPIKFLLQ